MPSPAAAEFPRPSSSLAISPPAAATSTARFRPTTTSEDSSARAPRRRSTTRSSNTGDGTSTPPFSNEQPAGFSGADKAGFYHNTFDPFYRDQEGAVPENTQVTLRFRTLHSSGIWGLTARAYLFDTASGTTTGPVDTSMPFEQNITDQRHRIRRLEGHAHDAFHNHGLLLQVQDQPRSDQRLVQRRLCGRQRQRPQGRHRYSHRRRAVPIVPDHRIRSQLPDAGLAAERQRVPHSARPFPQRRPDQRLLPSRRNHRLSHLLRPSTREASRPSPTTCGTRRSAIRAIRAPVATASSETSSMAAICGACRTNSTTSSRSASTPST